MTANLSQRRSHAREGAKQIEATITAALDELEAEKAAERAELKAARKAAQADRRRYIREDFDGVRAVRDRYGWHGVVRVNPTSVTIRTPYSWSERIPFGQILETRS